MVKKNPADIQKVTFDSKGRPMLIKPVKIEKCEPLVD